MSGYQLWPDCSGPLMPCRTRGGGLISRRPSSDLGLAGDRVAHGALVAIFRLNGMSTGLELEALLDGVPLPSARDHSVIAYTIDERCHR